MFSVSCTSFQLPEGHGPQLVRAMRLAFEVVVADSPHRRREAAGGGLPIARNLLLLWATDEADKTFSTAWLVNGREKRVPALPSRSVRPDSHHEEPLRPLPPMRKPFVFLT